MWVGKAGSETDTEFKCAISEWCEEFWAWSSTIVCVGAQSFHTFVLIFGDCPMVNQARRADKLRSVLLELTPMIDTSNYPATIAHRPMKRVRYIKRMSEKKKKNEVWFWFRLFSHFTVAMASFDGHAPLNGSCTINDDCAPIEIRIEKVNCRVLSRTLSANGTNEGFDLKKGTIPRMSGPSPINN